MEIIELESLDSPERIYNSLLKFSACIVRPKNKNVELANKFMSICQQYASLPENVKLIDVYPENHYQIGLTPENTEKSLCSNNENSKCQQFLNTLSELEKPTKSKIDYDPKSRFMYPITLNQKKTNSKFESLNPKKVSTTLVPNFEKIFEEWGKEMMNIVVDVANKLATHLDINPLFERLLKHGKGILAPTMINLKKFNQKDTVFAKFHQDISFLSIHSKSNRKGLDIWVDGKKMAVSIPEDCFLIQSGLQLEYITNSRIRAGWHEVSSKEDYNSNNDDNDCFRVSSTMFLHADTDEKIYGIYNEKENPRILVGDWLQHELNLIKL